MNKIDKLTKALCSVCLCLCFLSSCQDELYETDSADSSTLKSFSTENTIKGIVRVKLEETQAPALSVSLKSGALTTSISNIDRVLTSIGATSFKRTFPYAGKFEPRTVAEGLHLWYDIHYDTLSLELSEVLEEFSQLSEVVITEPIREIINHSIGNPVKLSTDKSTALNYFDYLFDDYYLSYQWHYYNDGSVTNAIAGCDINLMDAWKKQTGSSDVIVSIVDGGIDTDHEDLAENVWVNEAEYNGSSGVDDDDNGYVDDVYGYNFVTESGTIEDHYHGCHVAGTIGAVNGNSKGVCGIAGGDSENTGVRLMSCQVFQTDDRGEDLSAWDFEAAIKYGADNGAVISQNSWGYEDVTYMPASMQDAIDYFVKYAGYDENGIQTGLMAGGVVIFAAGNEYSSTDVYPAMYDQVIAVAACDPDYSMSYYSNYGSWVDISAPGGTDEDGVLYDSWITSTYSDNYYGYSIGTSMACPHVSGVAALVLSEFGGDGFTPDDLREKLYQGAINLDEYNPGYENMLGAGLVNAAGALGVYGIAPEVVSDLEAVVSDNIVTLKWSVTTDDDDVKASAYKVYYSNSSFSQSDVDAGSVESATVHTSSAYEVGDSITKTLSGLDYETTYYFGVAGYDYAGTMAEMTMVSASTGNNSAPLITSDKGDSFTLKSSETLSLNLIITEPDDHSYTWELSDETGNIDAAENLSWVELTISALDYDTGNYTATLIVTDEYGLSSDFSFSYTILENNAPRASQDSLYLYIGDPDNDYSIDLSGYFTDDDGEELDYSLSFDSDMLSASAEGDELIITSNSYGLTSVGITASDAKGADCSMDIIIMMRDEDQEIDVYPNPVSDYLYFRMGEAVDGNLGIKVYNSNGVLKHETSTAISTYSPAAIDLSDLASGEYKIKMTYDSQEMQTMIVKL